MAILSDPQNWISLIILIGLEIVLGFDNLVVLTIVSRDLPLNQQRFARRLGLSLAIILRLGLLALIFWLTQLLAPLFTLWGITFSIRDLVLFFGGLFLLYTALREICLHLSVKEKKVLAGSSIFVLVILKILVMDFVFSIDTVITAVGIGKSYWVMAAAVVIAVLMMILASDFFAHCVEAFPRIQTLALVFIFILGILLILEAFGVEEHRVYLYVAIGVAFLVEVMNILQERLGARKV